MRERVPDTPSHPGGLSEIARQRLEERQRTRDQPLSKPMKFSRCPLLLKPMSGDGGITSQSQKQPDANAPRGLGDFQRRSNRADRDYRRSGGRGAQNDDQSGRSGQSRGWADATPRMTPRAGRDDAPSVRVPNVAWDSTPRNQASGSGGGWGAARDRRWDAPTPRNVRGGDDDDAASVVGVREWEEEQVKLDRDWYMGSEGGAVSTIFRHLIDTFNLYNF